MPKDDVVCVSKEAVQNKNAVSLKLKETSSCVSSNTFSMQLCGLGVHQEKNIFTRQGRKTGDQDCANKFSACFHQLTGVKVFMCNYS